MDLKYKRVLLKISGEAFGYENNQGIDFEKAREIAELIKEIRQEGAQLAIVNGAGNLFRGAKQGKEIDREKADYIGMVATVMNSLSLEAVLKEMDVPVVTYSAIGLEGLVKEFDKEKANLDLENGTVVISTFGTGKPFFTTDTAGVQRAVDLGCDLMIKASNVDGVYSDDPNSNSAASKFEEISCSEILEKDLKVLDRSAVEIAKNNNLKIIVTTFDKESVLKALSGEKIGTLIA